MTSSQAGGASQYLQKVDVVAACEALLMLPLHSGDIGTTSDDGSGRQHRADLAFHHHNGHFLQPEGSHDIDSDHVRFGEPDTSAPSAPSALSARDVVRKSTGNWNSGNLNPTRSWNQWGPKFTSPSSASGGPVGVRELWDFFDALDFEGSGQLAGQDLERLLSKASSEFLRGHDDSDLEVSDLLFEDDENESEDSRHPQTPATVATRSDAAGVLRTAATATAAATGATGTTGTTGRTGTTATRRAAAAAAAEEEEEEEEAAPLRQSRDTYEEEEVRGSIADVGRGVQGGRPIAEKAGGSEPRKFEVRVLSATIRRAAVDQCLLLQGKALNSQGTYDVEAIVAFWLPPTGGPTETFLSIGGRSPPSQGPWLPRQDSLRLGWKRAKWVCPAPFSGTGQDGAGARLELLLSIDGGEPLQLAAQHLPLSALLAHWGPVRVAIPFMRRKESEEDADVLLAEVDIQFDRFFQAPRRHGQNAELDAVRVSWQTVSESLNSLPNLLRESSASASAPDMKGTEDLGITPRCGVSLTEVWLAPSSSSPSSSSEKWAESSHFRLLVEGVGTDFQADFRIEAARVETWYGCRRLVLPQEGNCPTALPLPASLLCRLLSSDGQVVATSDLEITTPSQVPQNQDFAPSMVRQAYPLLTSLTGDTRARHSVGRVVASVCIAPSHRWQLSRPPVLTKSPLELALPICFPSASAQEAFSPEELRQNLSRLRAFLGADLVDEVCPEEKLLEDPRHQWLPSEHFEAALRGRSLDEDLLNLKVGTPYFHRVEGLLPSLPLLTWMAIQRVLRHFCGAMRSFMERCSRARAFVGASGTLSWPLARSYLELACAASGQELPTQHLWAFMEHWSGWVRGESHWGLDERHFDFLGFAADMAAFWEHHGGESGTSWGRQDLALRTSGGSRQLSASLSSSSDWGAAWASQKVQQVQPALPHRQSQALGHKLDRRLGGHQDQSAHSQVQGPDGNAEPKSDPLAPGQPKQFSPLPEALPQLELQILNAWHLPLVEGRSPNSQVTYLLKSSQDADSRNNNDNNNSSNSSNNGAESGPPNACYPQGMTEVIYRSTCPAWEHVAKLSLPAFLLQPEDFLEWQARGRPPSFRKLELHLQVHHVTLPFESLEKVGSSGVGDRRLLGEAVVPLAPLATGFPEVDGYFHLSEGKSNSQIRAKVKPLFRSMADQLEAAWTEEAAKEGGRLEEAKAVSTSINFPPVPVPIPSAGRSSGSKPQKFQEQQQEQDKRKEQEQEQEQYQDEEEGSKSEGPQLEVPQRAWEHRLEAPEPEEEVVPWPEPPIREAEHAFHKADDLRDMQRLEAEVRDAAGSTVIVAPSAERIAYKDAAGSAPAAEDGGSGSSGGGGGGDEDADGDWSAFAAAVANLPFVAVSPKSSTLARAEGGGGAQAKRLEAGEAAPKGALDALASAIAAVPVGSGPAEASELEEDEKEGRGGEVARKEEKHARPDTQQQAEQYEEEAEAKEGEEKEREEEEAPRKEAKLQSFRSFPSELELRVAARLSSNERLLNSWRFEEELRPRRDPETQELRSIRELHLQNMASLDQLQERLLHGGGQGSRPILRSARTPSPSPAPLMPSTQALDLNWQSGRTPAPPVSSCAEAHHGLPEAASASPSPIPGGNPPLPEGSCGAGPLPPKALARSAHGELGVEGSPARKLQTSSSSINLDVSDGDFKAARRGRYRGLRGSEDRSDFAGDFAGAGSGFPNEVGGPRASPDGLVAWSTASAMDLLELSSLTSASGPASRPASVLRSFASQSQSQSQSRMQPTSSSQPRSQSRSLISSTFDSDLGHHEAVGGGRSRWASGSSTSKQLVHLETPATGSGRHGRGSLPASVLSTSTSLARSASSSRTKASKTVSSRPAQTLRDLVVARRLFDESELELVRNQPRSQSQSSTPSHPPRPRPRSQADRDDDASRRPTPTEKPARISRWAANRRGVTLQEADRIARIMRGSAERWDSDSD